MNSLTTIIPLTDEQRLDAQEKARAIVVRSIGQEPKWEQFSSQTVGRYPPYVTQTVGVLMFIVFVASAAPSLFRLFSAGRDYFLLGIPDETQSQLVGVSTFLLAEFVVILSTVSARIFFEGYGRFIFVIPVCMGLGMALVGNWTVVQPHDLFSLLETIVPVATVLFVALIGERLLLDSVERQHEGKRRFQIALREYKTATANPDEHPRYRQAYANQLKQAIVAANSKGAGMNARRELMNNLSGSEWRELVDRELAQDDWYTQPTPPKSDHAREVVTVPVIPFGSNQATPVDPESMLMTAPASVNGGANIAVN